MEDEKEKLSGDALVADSMRRLFGGLGAAMANPLKTTKPLTGGFRIVGVVFREDDLPLANVSIGMLGQECTTDAEGRFELKVEKK